VSGTHLALAGLTKRFGDTVAVDRLDLEVRPGTLTALLGPSACGKSTTLAMIAGLVEPDAGDVAFDGSSVLGVPPERREVGMVFQKPLLFPHLDVAANVAFGLRMRGRDRRRTRAEVATMLERVGLGPLSRRRVGELSGGQEQRVSLARALVLSPAVLLLDEPFSALDAGLRREMRALVRQLQDELAVTTVFVTHDQAEAVEIADRVALLLDGRLAGSGAPDLFYLRPPSLAAARFFGVTNEICGAVASGTFSSAGGRLHRWVSCPDGPAVLVVRPEALRLAHVPGPTTIPVTPVAVRSAGTHRVVHVAFEGGQTLQVHHPLDDPVVVGRPEHLRIEPAACTAFLGARP